MSHQLELIDLMSFQSKTRIAGAFGNGQNKSLNIVSEIGMLGLLTSKFTLEHNSKVIYTTDVLLNAIQAYNNI